MKKVIVLMFLLMSSISVLQAKTLQKPLGVKLQAITSYECTDKTKLNVRYYVLSDKSLTFVKVKVGADAVKTLPSVISGSGAKYSDGIQLTWWTKGDSGNLYASNGGQEDTWPVAHVGCVDITK